MGHSTPDLRISNFSLGLCGLLMERHRLSGLNRFQRGKGYPDGGRAIRGGDRWADALVDTIYEMLKLELVGTDCQRALRQRHGRFRSGVAEEGSLKGRSRRLVAVELQESLIAG